MKAFAIARICRFRVGRGSKLHRCRSVSSLSSRRLTTRRSVYSEELWCWRIGYKFITTQPARLPLQRKDRQLNGCFLVGAAKLVVNFFVALRRSGPGEIVFHRAADEFRPDCR